MSIARLSVSDGIARLVLDRPPGNTLDDPRFVDGEELDATLARPDLRGLVVVGQGRHFSGGADRASLSSAVADPVALGAALAEGKALLARLSRAPVPTVAAIRGQCLGAGLEIALACHFRVASSGAMLGFPEATLGLLPGLGGTACDLLRPGLLADLLITGRLVGAEEAARLGLVDEVVPPAEVEAAGERRIASLVAGRPPHLVRAILEAVGNGRWLPRAEALRRETELFVEVARYGQLTQVK